MAKPPARRQDEAATSMERYGIPPLVLGRSSFRATESERWGPTIVANPPGDREFRALIDASLLSRAARPEDLEAILRTRYPQAVVRPRELAGERTPVWYVYRDGHWIRSDDVAL